MRVLVTGGSGFIGSRLLEALAADDAVDEVVCVDVRAPAQLAAKVRFVERSVTEDLTDLVGGERPAEVVVHLAWLVDPLRDPARQRAICVGGTRRVLEACARARTPQLLFMSSATAYGAHPDHTEPLSEFCELRERYHFQYSREKREAELLCRRFARDQPGTCLQIVRPCVVGGPNVSNFLFRTLHRPVVMRPLEVDPRLQMVHEEDVARALHAILISKVPGAFNLAGEGAISVVDALARIGRRALPLPFPALYAANAVLWRLNARSLVEAPPGFLYFLRYPWQVSTERIRRELGFRCEHSADEVLEAYLRARA